MKMKLLKYKFWVILSMFLCTACGENRITRSVNESSDVTSPIGNTAPVRANPISDLDVPYVPTHQSIVDAMLRMAKVKGGDVLYDKRDLIQ